MEIDEFGEGDKKEEESESDSDGSADLQFDNLKLQIRNVPEFNPNATICVIKQDFKKTVS